MAQIKAFLGRKRGYQRVNLADLLTYTYLFLGVVIMFGPIVWLVMSSFKTPAALAKFPPTILPYAQETVHVPGYDKVLPLYRVTFEDGSTQQFAQVRRVGLEAQMIDPEMPDEIIKVPTNQTTPVDSIRFEFNNYTDPIERFKFFTFFKNSVIVTGASTVITLFINSMAAFALSKYQFRGRSVIFIIIVSTLMIPLSVVLVPVFWILSQIGWTNSLWGIIIPPAATPTGVFLLRQYMLSIPDELLDAARIDGASEWRVYWQVILPLATPALAVLAIFSIMWRWNDFLWPLIVLSESDKFTLQIGLNVFQGENYAQWNYILAMTVLTALPMTLIFAFLQRYITTGIASTGMKG